MTHGVARIRAAFRTAREAGRGALVTYTMGGDPDPRRFRDYLRAVADGGADVIEVGIPFSDPVADGPTIQAASVRALSAGTHPRDVLEGVRALRAEGLTQPVVVMTYANIPFTMGYEAFARALRAHGVDGAIIPDIPVDESGPLSDALGAEGLANVLLAAPLTRDARLERVARATQGFLYLVGSFGTTGARTTLAPETLDVLRRAVPVARAAEAPLAVGFGVSSEEQVQALVAAGADGVVVGSALVKMIEDGRPPAEVRDAVRRLRAGLAPVVRDGAP